MPDNNTNHGIDLGEGLRRVFLAGVGALATTAEKGQELINNLVDRGELTVDQGKKLNSELAHNAKEAKDTLQSRAQEATETVRNAAAGLRSQVQKDVAEDTAAPAADDDSTK